MPRIERITFVSDELDLGEKATDWLVAHISRDNACRHRINEKMFKVMKAAGVQRMVCPDCGCKCRLADEVSEESE